MNNELYDICMYLVMIGNRLSYGSVPFQYDNLMCAMKPGHPAEILADIFSDVGNKLLLDPDAAIELSKVKELRTNLQEFMDTFAVDQIEYALERLDAYIKEQEEES